MILGWSQMIRLTRLNRAPMVLNSDLIVHIEVTPDTVISLTTGETIMVLETSEEVVERIQEFRRSLFKGIFGCPPREFVPGNERT
jgi:flagellar protein FlbD